MNETTTRSQARAARRTRSEAQGQFPFADALVVPKRPARSRRSAAETNHTGANHTGANHTGANRAEASSAAASSAAANSTLMRGPETQAGKAKNNRPGTSGINGTGLRTSRRNLAPDAPLRRDIIGTTARDTDSSSTRHHKARQHGLPSRSKPKRPAAPRRYSTPTRPATTPVPARDTQRLGTDGQRNAIQLAAAVGAESIRILLAIALIAAAVLV